MVVKYIQARSSAQPRHTSRHSSNSPQRNLKGTSKETCEDDGPDLSERHTAAPHGPWSAEEACTPAPVHVQPGSSARHSGVSSHHGRTRASDQPRQPEQHVGACACAATRVPILNPHLPQAPPDRSTNRADVYLPHAAFRGTTVYGAAPSTSPPGYPPASLPRAAPYLLLHVRQPVLHDPRR